MSAHCGLLLAHFVYAGLSEREELLVIKYHLSVYTHSFGLFPALGSDYCISSLLMKPTTSDGTFEKKKKKMV